jgi:hypothetical protein
MDDPVAPGAAPAAPAFGPARRSGWRLWLAKLILLAVVGVFCLLALEVLVRVAMPYYNPRNQLTLHRNEDGVVLGFPLQTTRQGTPKGDYLTTTRINRHGYRDVKDYAEAGTNDIAVFGDSFSFGAGVEEEDRYSNQLERRLGVRVYNLATPAEDIRGYQRNLRSLERRGWRLRHVILGVCMENDLWDYDRIPDTHQVYRQQMVVTVRHQFSRWFYAHSALWRCCSHTLQRHDAVRGVFERLGVARSVDQLTHKNEASPQVVASSRNLLGQIATNQHTLLLLIPSRANWHGQGTAQEQETHRLFVEKLREAGLPFVDMKPVFEATGRPLDFYYRNDPHWNPQGHAAAAEALHQYLSQAPDWKFAVR